MINTLKNRIEDLIAPVLLTYNDYKEVMETERINRIPLYYEMRCGEGFWAVGFDKDLIELMQQRGWVGTLNYNKHFRCWTEKPNSIQSGAKPWDAEV